jgi:hypothetical protein
MLHWLKTTLFRSRWVALFVILYYLGCYAVHFEHAGQYNHSDQEGYTMYLPALFLRGGFEDMPSNTPYEYHPYPGTNKVFTRFTYGVALMEAPFYLLAMASRAIQGYPLDSVFAREYSIAILLAACFYTVLGLYFLQKILFSFLQTIENNEKRNRFIAGLTTFLILFGTNLLFYATKQPGMSHAYTFCLMSYLLVLMERESKRIREEESVEEESKRVREEESVEEDSKRVREKENVESKIVREEDSKRKREKESVGTIQRPTSFLSLFLSFFLSPFLSPFLKSTFVAALIILIRPTNAIVLLLWAVWNIGSWEDVKGRFAFFKKNWWRFWFVPIVFFLVALPQLFYWHDITGHWVYYSYDDQGFNWTKPEVYKIFFHLCNGFVPYTPMMVFAIVGLVLGAYKNVLNTRLSLFIFILLAYVCASWWNWWFGGAYGYRSFLDFYPIFALGLAYFIYLTLKSRFLMLKIVNLTVLFVLGFFCFRMITDCYNFQVEATGERSELFLPAVKRCFWIK